MMDKLRQQKQKLLDPESQQRDPSFRDEANTICPSLTYQERVIGCVTCFTLGFLLSLGSTFRLAKLVHGNPGPFAMAYTMGNLLSLASSMFFVGPCKQLQLMFHHKRRISAIVYIVFIGFTLALCFSPHVPHRVGLVLICVITQFTALVWYTLSYVPYGRKIALSCCKRMCGVADEDM
ncbi:Vesicle transport protein [Globisporangium polare]